MHNFGYTEEDKAGSVGDIRLWQRILAHSRGYFPAIASAVILSLVVTAGTLTLPYLIKTGIDTYIMATQLDAAQRSAGLTHIGLVFVLLVILGVYHHLHPGRAPRMGRTVRNAPYQAEAVLSHNRS